MRISTTGTWPPGDRDRRFHGDARDQASGLRVRDAGADMPGFLDKAKAMARAGVYNIRIHLE
jgi:hypothetical protein